MAAYYIDDALLRDLLGALSHDVRNPLAAVVTNLEFARRLTRRQGIDPDLAEAIDDSATACEVLRLMVANLDVLVQGKRIVSSVHDVELAGLIDEVVKRCESRAAQAGIGIDVAMDRSKRRAMLDVTLFGVAFENLIANSVQHAPRNSTVVVTLLYDGDEATLYIDDKGAPVPVESRGAALSGEGHTSAGRKQPTRYGRGLGLLAARAAAEATGVTLELGEHDGSRMTLCVPLMPDAVVS